MRVFIVVVCLCLNYGSEPFGALQHSWRISRKMYVRIDTQTYVRNFRGLVPPSSPSTDNPPSNTWTQFKISEV